VRLVQRTLKWVRQLQKYVDRPWYPLVLAGLTFSDLFIVVVPSDGIVVASSAARPKKWFLIGCSMTLGSVLGALLLAALTHAMGESFINWLSPNLLDSEVWIVTTGWFDRWGVWAVFLVAISPLAQQPIILMAAMADMPLPIIGLCVGGGRLIKFLGYAWIASHSPKLINKIPALRDELKDLDDPE